ncbi:MAG: HD-GYP domain-containing protein, partial [Vicinamibacterales bacterium]
MTVLARAYVTSVIAGGALVLAAWGTIPDHGTALFFTLLLCSSLASALKVNLPFTSSGSTMSVSYAVDFASLLLLGADATLLVAAVSAWAQCTFRTQVTSPLHRMLFSVASLVLTVKVAGLIYAWLGGPVAGTPLPLLTVARPLVGAAIAYFLCNTAFVATAIALTTGQPPLRVWNENFLWSAPSYFVGAGAAALGASLMEHGGSWLAVLLAAPIYLTYRTYKTYLGRLQDQQRHVQQVSDLHLATIEALALAINAKDQTTQSHIRRVQVYAAGVADALGMSPDDIQGVKTAALLHDIGKL